MTFKDFFALLKETNIPFSYRFFKVGDVPPLPYGVYYSTGDDSFIADGQNYFSAHEITIELYTAKKEPATEKKLEKVLTEAGFIFKKSEIWLSDEKMFEIIYNTEV